MSTLEQVRATEEAMKKARAAYLHYVEQTTKGKDITTHRRLITELKEASDLYFQAALDLK